MRTFLLWMRDNYEKVILWLILLCWMTLGWRLYNTWARTLNPSALELGLKPQVRWDPETVNKNVGDETYLAFLSPRPFTYYREILSRNPFAPLPPFTPPEPTVTPTPGETPKTEERMDLVCTGLMQIGELIATIQNKRTGRTYFVKEGDVVEGWKVEKITSSSIILFKEGKPKFELKIGG